VIASQALHVTGRAPLPALRPLVDEVRNLVPPVAEDRVLGPELGRLAERFTQRVFAVE
jgi:histidine ammonia-lyase